MLIRLSAPLMYLSYAVTFWLIVHALLAVYRAFKK